MNSIRGNCDSLTESSGNNYLKKIDLREIATIELMLLNQPMLWMLRIDFRYFILS